MMFLFARHSDKPLLNMIVVQKPIVMPGEQKHNISFIPFFFFITYKFLTCERRLYLPFTTYKSTTESATLRPLNSGLFF